MPDNIMLAHELIDSMKRNPSKKGLWMSCKVNFGGVDTRTTRVYILKSWHTIILSKHQGGLNIKRSGICNKAPTPKLAWRVVSSPKAL